MPQQPFINGTRNEMRIRLPEDLKQVIAEAAKAAGISMNAEIVKRLQASDEWHAAALLIETNFLVKKIAERIG